MALIDDVKTALRIKHNALDDQINRLISTSRQEMIRAGVMSTVANDENNLVVTEAVITFVQWKNADTVTEMEAYENSWKYQLDCLRKSSFIVSGGDGNV